MATHLLLSLLLPLLPGSVGSSVDEKFIPFKEAFTADQKFSTAHTRKHDFCSTNAVFGRNFQKSLAGHEISVVMMPNQPFVLYNKTSQMITGGYLLEVFEEVMRRTGLVWHNSTAVVDPPDASAQESYDGWIAWGVDHYDIVVGDFAATAERGARGFRFAFPILNESPQLIGQVKVHEPPWYEKLFTFGRPFTLKLWFSIFAAFVFTALIYAMIETKEYLLEAKEYVIVGIDEPDESDESMEHWFRNLGQSLYLTIASFTSGGVFRPRTGSGKLFVLSWTFAVLVLVASYTANMASMLVVESRREVQITSINEAIKRNLPVCVYPGGAFDGFMKTTYPDLTIKYPTVWGYHNLRNGNCVALVKNRLSFQIDEGLKAYNAACDLEIIGQPLLEVHGSFVAKTDSGSERQDSSDTLCTDLLLDVINSALHDMMNDGWLAKKKAAFLKSVHDMHCSGDAAAPKDKNGALDVENLSGLFAVHVVFAILCLFVNRCHESPSKKVSASDDTGVRSMKVLELGYDESSSSDSESHGSGPGLRKDASGSSIFRRILATK